MIVCFTGISNHNVITQCILLQDLENHEKWVKDWGMASMQKAKKKCYTFSVLRIKARKCTSWMDIHVYYNRSKI